MAVVRYSAGNPQVIPALDHSSSTHSRGDLVKIDTDGIVKIATTGAITGIARKNWTSSAGATEVELIDLNALYTINCGSTTAVAALGSDGDITFTTTAQTVASNTSSGVDVLIVALDPRDAVGASGGRYLCRFLPTVVAGG